MTIEAIEEISETEWAAKRQEVQSAHRALLAEPPSPLSIVPVYLWVPQTLAEINSAEAKAANAAHHRELKERQQAIQNHRPIEAAMRAFLTHWNQRPVNREVVKIYPA